LWAIHSSISAISAYSALLLGFVGDRFEAAGFLCVVQDPGLQALDDQADGLVVVHAVHAGDAVATGATSNFRLALVAHFDQTIKAVASG
jgi:hypothetical protein